MLGDDEHVYAVAWREEDNPGIDVVAGDEPKWWRVYRFRRSPATNPVTEPMSRDEARAKCADIIKLTGGKNLWEP